MCLHFSSTTYNAERSFPINTQYFQQVHRRTRHARPCPHLPCHTPLFVWASSDHCAFPIAICCPLPLAHLHTQHTESAPTRLPLGSLCTAFRTDPSLHEVQTSIRIVPESPTTTVAFVYRAHGAAVPPNPPTTLLTSSVFQHTHSERETSMSPPPCCVQKHSLRPCSAHTRQTNHPALRHGFLPSVPTTTNSEPRPAHLRRPPNRTAPRRSSLFSSPRLGLRRPCRCSLCSSDAPIYGLVNTMKTSTFFPRTSCLLHFPSRYLRCVRIRVYLYSARETWTKTTQCPPLPHDSTLHSFSPGLHLRSATRRLTRRMSARRSPRNTLSACTTPTRCVCLAELSASEPLLTRLL